MKQLKFGWPRRGLEGTFNTFRLGSGHKTLQPGEHVELVCARSGKVLKTATVTEVHRGKLAEMAQLHAHAAHNWKTHPEAERPGLLIASLSKRYPPGRVRDDSDVVVIYMKEEVS